MGLLQTVMAGAVKAIKAVGDLAVDIEYVRVVPGVYDPNTGVTADTTTIYPLKLPLLRLLESEVSWFPAPDKVQRVIIPFPMLPIELGRNDQVRVDGQPWEVKKTRSVPGGAIHILYLENPGPTYA